MPQLLPYLQVPVLAVGLALSVVLGHQIARENISDHARARRSVIPVAALLTLLTVALLWLYIG